MSRLFEPGPRSTAWIDEQLSRGQLIRTGEPCVRSDRPWAIVQEIPLATGRAWFKACAPATSHEVALYALFARIHAGRFTVRALGIDVARGWVLLEDAGPPIAETQASQAAAIADSLVDYGRLQRMVVPHVDELLASGIPDMRPTRMLDRFDEALSLGAVDRDTTRRLQRHRPIVADWCDRLVESPVEPSIDHNDLHPWNMIRGEGATRFYDWGDSVIAHPFAALLVPLGFLTRAHGCNPYDPPVIAAVDNYVEAVTQHRDLERRADCLIACRVAKIARALTWHRSLSANRGANTGFDSAVSDTLTSVLDTSYLGGA